MTAPEGTFIAWPNPTSCGLAFRTSAKNRTGYVRADIADARVMAERAACTDELRLAVEAARREGYELARANAAKVGWHLVRYDVAMGRVKG